MCRLIHIICFLILFPQILIPGYVNSNSDQLRILIIAGQSNAINIHTDASELELSLIDTSVSFYYHCGMPPLSGIPFFSTSGNKWTTLGIQRQVPYVAQNEYFFGPEITLINGLDSTPGNFAVIKCAYGGSNLAADWDRNSVSGNMLYKIMVEQINIACSILDSIGMEYNFAGFFWIQGESDASKLSYAQAYYENLKKLIDGIRFDLNAPGLPFIISRLPSGQPYPYLSIIRSAQEKAALDILNTKCIDTDSLELDGDNVHFNSSGIKKLGYLLADAYTGTASSNNEFNSLPDKKNFILRQNYPNPFNPVTTIGFSLPNTEYVVIKVYDLLGKEVSVLINKELQPGVYEFEFNAEGISSGIYFYRMSSGDFSAIKKMQVLR